MTALAIVLAVLAAAAWAAARCGLFDPAQGRHAKGAEPARTAPTRVRPLLLPTPANIAALRKVVAS